MNEMTEGTYKILGKSVKICRKEGEISLLRNTVFSRLKLDRLQEFQDIFSNPELSALTGEEGLTTVIKGTSDNDNTDCSLYIDT